MNEMLNYVFKSMKTTERALAKLEKTCLLYTSDAADD